jgi:hypothetical protein
MSLWYVYFLHLQTYCTYNCTTLSKRQNWPCYDMRGQWARENDAPGTRRLYTYTFPGPRWGDSTGGNIRLPWEQEGSVAYGDRAHSPPPPLHQQAWEKNLLNVVAQFQQCGHTYRFLKVRYLTLEHIHGNGRFLDAEGPFKRHTTQLWLSGGYSNDDMKTSTLLANSPRFTTIL